MQWITRLQFSLDDSFCVFAHIVIDFIQRFFFMTIDEIKLIFEKDNFLNYRLST